MTGSALSIGVDIGGTKVLGGVVDGDGRILAEARRETPAEDAAKTLELITEVVQELAPAHPVVAVGVGAAGWVDRSRSTVVFAPNLAWRNEPLRERLGQRLDLPVRVENDANAAAWAEFRFGVGRSVTESMVMLTIGTGVGGGVVLGGELVRGAHGFAGELGHVQVVPDGRPCGCGRRGCLEQYASGTALARYARDRAVRDPLDATILLDLAGGRVEAISGLLVSRAARAGDRASLAAFAEMARWLGIGLADLVQVLDPQLLVLGGGVVEAGALLLEPTRAAVAHQLSVRGRLPVAPVVPARLGNRAGLVGVADLARG